MGLTAVRCSYFGQWSTCPDSVESACPDNFICYKREEEDVDKFHEMVIEC